MRKTGLFILFVWCLSFAVWAEGADLTLPELPGWKASFPDFATYKSNLAQAFYLKRTYRKDNGASLEVLLAGGPEGKRLMQAFENRFEFETENFYLRYRKEGGYRLFTSYDRQEKKGIIAVFLQEDPIIILVARYTNLNDQEALELLKKLNWQSLKEKALKQFERSGKS